MESNTSTIKWKVIYPIYMNSKKTIAEGRRLPVNKGVENPTAVELYEVCKYLGLPTELEVIQYYLLITFIKLFSRPIKHTQEITHKEEELESNYKNQTIHFLRKNSKQVYAIKFCNYFC